MRTLPVTLVVCLLGAACASPTSPTNTTRGRVRTVVTNPPPGDSGGDFEPEPAPPGPAPGPQTPEERTPPQGPPPPPGPPPPGPPSTDGGLPRATHTIDFAYMVDDSLYGNFRSTAGDRVTTYLVWAYLGATDKAAWIADSLRDARSRGGAIVFGPDVSPAAQLDAAALASLDAAAPFWRDVSTVYFDEPGFDVGGMDALLDAWAAQLGKRGLASKPVWVNFTRGQLMGGTGWRSNRIACVGVEAYADPSTQNLANVTDLLRTDLEQQLDALGGRCAFVVGQAYDRNGAWRNEESLAAIQRTPYEVIYNRGNVAALWWFSLGRPGGTLDHPRLAEQHRAIVRAAR